MPVFPSEEWVKELEKITVADEEYKKAGAEWEGDIIMIMEAEPGKLDKPFYYYSKPHRGELLEAKVLDSLEGKTAAYLISSVFAALGGWLVLGERLTPRGVVGCCLMLGAADIRPPA